MEDEHLVALDDDWALWRTVGVRGAGLPFDLLEHLAATGDGPREGLVRLTRVPGFVAALAWQNPHACGFLVPPAPSPDGHDRPARRWGNAKAAALAGWAQRYCAKNDTIGFFGPVGWAQVDEHEPRTAVVSGGLGIRRAGVYVEHRLLADLADGWAADPRVRPHLPLRRHSAVSLDGTTLRRPYRPPATVGALTAALVAAADGRGLAATLDAVAAAGHDRALVADEADRLIDARVLVAGFRLPVGMHTDRFLRAEVERLGDPVLRGELTAVLDELDGHRARLADVLTVPEPLRERLRDLETFLGKVTGARSVVTKQDSATGRTPVFPDCRWDLDARLGAPALDALRPALAILLGSARWLAAEVADAAEQELVGIHRRLRRRRGEVTLAELHFAAADVLEGRPGTAVHGVVEDFHLRWQELLPAGIAGADVRADPDELAAPARRLFPPREPRWAAARYHSPDLMLAEPADGGAPFWVLGELHVAMNTLDNHAFLEQHDDPAVLHRAVAADMAGGRIVPSYPPGDTPDSRRYPPPSVRVPGRYLNWSFADDVGHPAGGSSWPGTALVVDEHAGRLTAGPRDAAWRAPVLEFLGEFLSALVVNRFRVRPPATPGPRVRIGDVVVARRTWTVPVRDAVQRLGTAEQHRTDAFAGWLRDLGLPRHLFVRSPLNPKPFYLDLDAPLLVRNVGKVVRTLAAAEQGHDAHLELSEMTPGPDQLWLADPAGRRRTSELRFVAVQRPDGPAPAPAWAGDPTTR